MNEYAKKTAAVLLAGTMLLGAVSGCTQDTPTGSGTPAPTSSQTTDLKYPVTPDELGSGEVKWAEEETKDGWMKVTNTDGATLGYSPDSGVKLLQVEGYAFKDLNQNGLLDAYEDWRLDVDTRNADLVAQLSVEEMAGLMLHANRPNLEEDGSDMFEALDNGIRFVLNNAPAYPTNTQAKWANAIQAYAESGGHGIPVNISTNPRSTPTFPSNLGLAATFDPELGLEIAKQMSVEYRALGLSTLLGPQIDLASDPRWCRIEGTFGEDPALSRDMTAAAVAGHQSTYDENGNDLGWGADSVNAMMKHWPGDGTGESGRESHDVYGQYAVYPGGQFETSLIPFVDGGLNSGSATGDVSGVMTSYSIAWSEDESLGELVGSAYSEYKMDLLHAYGFEGIVCTDWGVLKDMDDRTSKPDPKPYGVEELTKSERCYKAIMVGADQIGGEEDVTPVLEAYDIGVEKQGEEAMTERFRASATRLLKTTFQVGLFENPYISLTDAVNTVGGEESAAAGYEAHLKSIVMLKNSDNTIKAADENAEKPTVYIPKLFRTDKNGVGSITDGVDMAIASQYFNVVTDTVSETLTGPADADGNPTATYEDLIRATPEQLAECDYALVFVNSPMNRVWGSKSGGYNTETYVPLSLQYGPYTADSSSVRLESISGPMVETVVASVYGDQKVQQKQNCSYFGQSAEIYNSADLDAILYAAENMPEEGKVIVSIDADNPTIVSEFESQVDAILIGFRMNKQAVLDIVTGKAEPSALLPFQLPANMETVEAQYEDVPRDMECHVDTDGNTYDFGFGLNWSGVIQDERTEKYCVEPLVSPETQPSEG